VDGGEGTDFDDAPRSKPNERGEEGPPAVNPREREPPEPVPELDLGTRDVSKGEVLGEPEVRGDPTGGSGRA
jgi:hypothetical protein